MSIRVSAPAKCDLGQVSRAFLHVELYLRLCRRFKRPEFGTDAGAGDLSPVISLLDTMLASKRLGAPCGSDCDDSSTKGCQLSRFLSSTGLQRPPPR